MSDKIIDRHFNYTCQNFPLYWYEKIEKSNQGELDLFAENSEQKDQYIRRDGISDWIKKRADEQYNCKVSKEQIFYYVYGFLHLESYRKKFANNLKKELPKIPLVEDYATFEKISKAGRELAELHLHFEPEPTLSASHSVSATTEQTQSLSGVNATNGIMSEAKVCSECINTSKATAENKQEIENLYEKYYIKKVEESKDKRELLFFDRANNVFERLPIPFEVDKWQINGSTATWWIADRYKVTVDKKTGRINDPNDYAREYGNPRYIFELAKNVINIAIKTVAILDELNKLQVEI